MKSILLAGLLFAFPLASSAKFDLFSSFSTNKPATSATTSLDDQVSILADATPIDPKVLKLALTAYNCAANAGQNKQEILTIVDYSRPSSEKRMWVLDLAQNKVLFHSLVAHGQGSGEVMPTRFSNKAQTHASSLGLFVTGEVYQGKHGQSLRLHGMEENFNENALSRAIVVHGAKYVNASLAKSGRIGRSWGCPAVPQELAQPIIDSIKGGSVVFAYYPHEAWLEKSKYLNCSVA